nr:hypothetical protein [Gammaproteobacteria bacterium]
RDSINKSSEKGNEKKYSGSVNKRRRSNSTAPNPFDIVSFSYQGLNLIEKLKTFRYSAQDSVMNGYIRGAQSNYEGLIYNGSLEQKQAFINELNGTVAALEQEHTQQKSIKQFSDKLKNTRVPELVNEAHRIGKAITQKLPQDRAQVIN